MGDSVTEGMGVGDSETIARVLIGGWQPMV